MIIELIRHDNQFEFRTENYFNNQLLYFNHHFEPIQINSNFLWKAQEHFNRTETVYFDSLLIVHDLMRKYSQNQDKKFLSEAYNIVCCWYEQNKDNILNWNEHSTSNRVLYISLILEQDIDVIMKTQLNNILNEHLKFLSIPEYYKENNHGLMMDKALFVGAMVLEDSLKKELYVNTALLRFKNFLYRDFTSKGVHVENSPEYHLLAINVMKNMESILQYFNYKQYSRQIKDILSKASVYLGFIKQFDRSLPLIGDTSYKLITSEDRYGLFVDNQIGISVYKTMNHFLFFSNGFLSKTHKHFDNLNLLYSYRKTPILIDSGKYNYEKNNSIREHIKSVYAHNVAYIESNWKQQLTDATFYDLGHHNNEHYLFMEKEIRTKLNCISRAILFMKKYEVLIIVDRFICSEDDTCVSNYIFSPNLKVEYNHMNEIRFNKLKMINFSRQGIYCEESYLSEKFNNYFKHHRYFIKSKPINNKSTHTCLICNENLSKIKLEVNNNIINLNVEQNIYHIPMNNAGEQL